MSNWLDQQPESLLKEWLRRTNTPMLAKLPSGEILWCNEAFESLLGWAGFELIGKFTWFQITNDREECAAGRSLAEESARGDRSEYQLQKTYRTKNGPPRRVIIDVLRYPHGGDFECLLVSVFPVDRGVEFAMGQLTEIRSLMIQLIDNKPEGLTFAKLMQFHKEHPLMAWLATAVLTTLLFGERIAELARLAVPK